MNTSKMAIRVWGLLMVALIINSPAAAGDQNAPIIVGVLENSKFAYADMMRKSFDLALEEIEARGGINGRKLQLVFADDKGEKRKGVQAVRTLVRRKGAVMLTGGYSSTNTLAMVQTADRQGIPFLVCTAADDRITQHHRLNIFRLNPPAEEYARGLESMIEARLKPKSMAVIYENSPFGTSGAMQMMRFCRKNDIAIRDLIPYHKERAAADYFDRLIATLTADPPEAIYLVSYKKDGVLMVQRIRAAGIKAHLMGGAGGFTHPQFIAETAETSNFMTTATLWTADVQNLQARRYAQLYRDRFQETPDYHGAEAYSALLVVADALARAKTLKSGDIREALVRTRLETPFGHVAFESYAHHERQNRQPTLVLQVQDGRYTCVWPPELSVASLILPARHDPLSGIRDAAQ